MTPQLEEARRLLQLARRDEDFPRTHDLENLAGRLAGTPHALPFPIARLRPLTPYAVDFRYDDEAVSLLSDAEMRAIVAEALDFASRQLELR